jgi:hypothetical protein
VWEEGDGRREWEGAVGHQVLFVVRMEAGGGSAGQPSGGEKDRWGEGDGETIGHGSVTLGRLVRRPG